MRRLVIPVWVVATLLFATFGVDAQIGTHCNDTTDGTQYLPDAYATTDGTIPWTADRHDEACAAAFGGEVRTSSINSDRILPVVGADVVSGKWVAE